MTEGQSVQDAVIGDFISHRVTKEVEAQVTATLMPDRRSIEVTTAVDVPLSDFSIPRPEFLFMRVGEVQRVEAKFIAKMNP